MEPDRETYIPLHIDRCSVAGREIGRERDRKLSRQISRELEIEG